MKYLSRSITGLFIGVIGGGILGAVVEVIYWYVIQPQISPAWGRLHFSFPFLALFIIVGAVLMGGLGLVIGLVVAFLKRPKANPLPA